jgi:hypothetical protein
VVQEGEEMIMGLAASPAQSSPMPVDWRQRHDDVEITIKGQQPVDITHALADGNAKLGKMGADGADQAAALADQQISRSVKQDDCLLVGALTHRSGI